MTQRTLKIGDRNPRRIGPFPIDDGFRGSDDLDQTACSPRSHRTSLRTSSQERNFLLQRQDSEMGSFGSIARAETALTRDFGRHAFENAALLRVSHSIYNYRVWVVEMIWTKLVTPQPVIEPVADRASPERNFSMQRQRGEFAPISAAGSRTGSPRNCAGLRPKMCPRIRLDRKPALFQQRGTVRPLYLLLIGV
jgi:hypothetical protein